MDLPDHKTVIEGVALLFAGALAWRLFDTRKDKDTGETKGVGVRFAQILTLVLLLPFVLILGLEGLLRPDALSALLGVIAGYVLSGLALPVPASRARSSQTDDSN